MVAKDKSVKSSVLSIDGLTIAYGSNKAVDNVSFSIKRGEIFGLLGSNGAGKTRTLSAIEGLVKPHSGILSLSGVDIRQHPSEVKANIGVQLQVTSFQSELTINQIIKLYAGLCSVRLSNIASQN